MKINIPILYTRNGIEIFKGLAKNINRRILIDDNEILIFALQEFEKALLEENNESRLKLLEKEFNYVLNYGKEENLGFDFDFKETRTLDEVAYIQPPEYNFHKGKKTKDDEQEGFGGIFSVEEKIIVEKPLKNTFSKEIQVKEVLEDVSSLDIEEFNLIEESIIEEIIEIDLEPEPEYILSEKDLDKINQICSNERFELLEKRNDKIQNTIYLIAIFLHKEYNQKLYLLSFYNDYLLTNEYAYLCYRGDK